ncbi:hypothetical protein N0V84_009486 [Fusarium piperis]|uniref:Prion-inhibition and propagation HeLo domain-containing protein n=1 Tax=Fusarium piperis TaxID=1435070 RepID=A0A9W8W663_9HYPO|nr:hypothetical protein N0V84_009486 [Fusarium piperis]
MTEIFGAVSGAISIAALFNDCVDCFEYIQLARHFGEDYGRCQLRLDVAKWRLDRWGAAVDINNDPRFRSCAPADESVLHAQKILRDVVGEIECAYKVSSRYDESTMPEQDRMTLTHADLDPTSQRLRNQFQAITKKRQGRTSLIKKTGWALYDKKQLESLIESIVKSINDLEHVFPSANQAMQLARTEIEQVKDQQALHLIQDVANKVDPDLHRLAREKLGKVEVQNFAARIKTAESGKFHVGNIITKEGLGQPVNFPYSTNNSAQEIEVKGNSGVHVGDTYGGKGFWD